MNHSRVKKKNCVVVGSKKQMSNNKLPTVMDVIRHYLWQATSSLDETSKTIEEIWKTAGIPTISKRSIFLKLKKLFEKYKQFSKEPKSRSNNKIFKSKVSTFQKHAEKLFDVSSCKCTGSICNCADKCKISDENFLFLIDQRENRSNNITSKKILRNEQPLIKVTKNVSQEDSNSEDDLACIDPNFEPPATQSGKQSKKSNSLEFNTVALVSDRYGLSHTATAAVVSSTLQDIGLLNSTNKELVVDRCKIKRARQSLRKKLKYPQKKTVSALFFDGRKDQTLIFEKQGSISKKKIIVEEHVSLIGQPDGRYLGKYLFSKLFYFTIYFCNLFTTYVGHVVVSSGKAQIIKTAILTQLAEQNTSSNFLAVGCDGTVCNTETNSGIIRLMEEHLKRPIQWIVCLLHFNELPLRHFIQHLDGKTTGPHTYSGDIGKLLKNSVGLPVKKFASIASELPVIDSLILSTDQKYLYDICTAIKSGMCKSGLAERNPGNMSHSRWLTTANHILRVYIGTLKPTKNLKEIVLFIIKVYAPTWFSIKKQNSCTKGAEILWKFIQNSRYLRPQYRSIIDKVVQRNGFFAHHENILLSMLVDSRSEVRHKAFLKICHIRQAPSVGIRKFVVPKINFQAKEYYNMVNWDKQKWTEPPLTSNLSIEELQTIESDGEKSEIFREIINIPCHTQDVERCVKMVTEASQKVAGPDARDGYIRSQIKSRSLMPKFGSKKDFKQ